MTENTIFSKRRAYAAKFAGISFWTNACLSYSSLLYLRFFGEGVSQRIEEIVSQNLPDFVLRKLQFLAAFDGFSHIGFVVTTFFQMFLFLPMALLFLVMHSRAPQGENIENFFSSYYNYFWILIIVCVTIYVIYFDSLSYGGTVKALYFTIWPVFPFVSAILGVLFQHFLLGTLLLITGKSPVAEAR